MIARVLEKTGAMVLAWGAMYKTVEQSVLSYGIKSWVMTGEMLKVLTALHHRAARRITRITAKRRAGAEWEYSLVEKAVESAGLHPIRVYIKRRKKTISERVA